MADDDRLIGALTAALVKAAIDIAYEDPETDNHNARVALAYQVLSQPTEYAERFRWGVTSNATVLDKWTNDDIAGAVGDLQFVINSLWDAYSRSLIPA
jgi:hypothetical protein